MTAPLSVKAVAVLVLLGAPVACTLGPDHVVPDVAVPATWSETPGAGLSTEPADLASWWAKLGDPGLDRLMMRALENNHDLRFAHARLREARALRIAAGAAAWPQVEAGASYGRSQGSEATALAQFGGAGAPIDLYDVGLDASWEIDLWGRVARGMEAADADAQATEAEVRETLVALAAEVGAGYVDMLAFALRLDIARRNVRIQTDTLEITRARFDTGLVSELDTAQAERVLEDTRSTIPPLELGLTRARNRLVVLVGCPAEEVDALVDLERGIPVPPDEIAVGLPADLVRRRPDVHRAERVLAAETARIGVAEAELYPRLSLFGSLGLQSAAIDDLPGSSALATNYGAGITWPLFEGGRLRALVAAQDARAEQALATYVGRVRIAIEEAENAIAALRRDQERRAALVRAADRAGDALRLSRDLYTEGLQDFQTVLDAQRSLADLEDRLAASSAAVAADVITLYEALGGF